jgi:hypothetical protein
LRILFPVTSTGRSTKVSPPVVPRFPSQQVP